MEFPTGYMLKMILKQRLKTAAFWAIIGLFLGWATPILLDFFNHLKYVP